MKKFWVTLVILILGLLAAMTAGFCFGSAAIPLPELLRVLAGQGQSQYQVILLQLRLPRVLAGVLAGVGMAGAGVLLQSVTGNELASPNLIGINSGAGMAVILTLTFVPAAGRFLPVAAFLGAFGAALLILAVARWLSGSQTAIILIGIAMTTLLNAVISFFSLLDEDILAQYNHFTIGSLKAVRLSELGLPALLIALGVGVSMLLSGRLKIMCLGDSAAAALGVRVRRLRLTALACAAACAASVVSFAGLLGFVGLIVPHIARRMVGQRPERLLPAAGLIGGILVLLADLLGRVLAAPAELPVGILMALLGAPYFLWMLFRRRGYAGI